MNRTVWSFVFFYLILVAGVLCLPTQILVHSSQDAMVHNQSSVIVDAIAALAEREDEIRAGLLYDAERGVVVWEKHMYHAYPIASLTKMMVALLTVEDVRAGKVDWSDEVPVERLYRKSRRSRRVYRSTEIYTLEALVQLAMIPSNNQACVDIARYLNGSPEAFVQRMNAKARSLGMKNTLYFNPSGLPGGGKEIDNIASPHDLLLLALEMIKFEEILKITSIGFAEIGNKKRTGVFRNHNHLVIDYENDVDGLKTGFTRRAKYCLVATAKKEGHRLISVVLGVDSPLLRNEIVASMLNTYYAQIGRGPMIPTRTVATARKRMVISPAAAHALPEANRQVTYKTVWSKQRKSHIVRSGETLSTIAKRYKVTYQQVKKWNRLRSNRILKGQRLYVYVSVPKKVAVKNADVLDNEDETVADGQDGALPTVENGRGPVAVPAVSAVTDAERKIETKIP
jgi:D-alanyl-D-alanine carboxypeptidase (penicillin-binding protein 5/6)